MNSSKFQDANDLYDDFDVKPQAQPTTSRFQPAPPPTSFGLRGTPTAMAPMTAARLDTATAIRPMTSKQGAGYQSSQRKGPGTSAGFGTPGLNTTFDPLNQANNRAETTPSEQWEQLAKTTEKKLHQLVEESCLAAEAGKLQEALDKAKEAAKKERQLSKERQTREGNSATDASVTANPDITYCVLFNLANQLHLNKLYQESLNTYSLIVKNKQFYQSGRLRLNMGNIYFEQKKYAQAIKMYRMALDQVSPVNKMVRLKIMRNVGVALLKLGQYQDAAVSFESIMESVPDYQAGFNLILCYYALGESERMKKAFLRMVSAPVPVLDQDDQEQLVLEEQETHMMKDDKLKAMAKEKRQSIEQSIIYAARIIAPAIEATFQEGFDWTVNTIKTSPWTELASELEAAKASFYLRSKEIQKAIEVFEKFEKQDPRMLATASNNLSVLAYLQGNTAQAEHHADTSIQSDRYNAKSLVNRGNCYFQQGRMDPAKQCYLDAINLDALCHEAHYNLGLVYARLGRDQDAVTCFEKVHAGRVQGENRGDAEVVFQVAVGWERLRRPGVALEWYTRLMSLVPTDPFVLARVAALYQRQNDKAQAFHYYSESHRYFPSNLDVLSWLGTYFVDNEAYEQAIHYFEKALLIQPGEIQWYLMIGSCLRRSGNYQQALDMYKRTYELFPANVDCLHFIIRICTDLGLQTDAHEYMMKLQQVESTTLITHNYGHGRHGQEQQEVQQVQEEGEHSPFNRHHQQPLHSSSTSRPIPLSQSTTSTHTHTLQQLQQQLQQQQAVAAVGGVGTIPGIPGTLSMKPNMDEIEWDDVDVNTLLPD